MILFVRLAGDPQAARMRIVALVDRSTPESARSQVAFVAAHATLVHTPADVAALRQLIGHVEGPSATLRLPVADDDPLVIRFFSSAVAVDLLSKSAVAAHPEVLRVRLRQLSARTTPS